MHHIRFWISCLLCALLAACAGAPSRSARPVVAPLQLRDCATLYPHPDSVVDVTGPGVMPAALVATGQGHLSAVRFQKCRVDNAKDKNAYLKQLGAQLQYDLTQVQADVATYEKQSADGQAQSAAYNTDCKAPNLDNVHYRACLKRAEELNKFIAQVNAEYPILEARHDDVNNRVAAYDQDARAMPDELRGTYADYTAALKPLGRWMDQVRNLLYLPANQAQARQADCPAVSVPAKTIDEMESMAADFVSCLGRMPEVELVQPLPSSSGFAALAGADHGP